MKKLILLSILFIVGCNNSTEPTETHGCLDSKAINYNANATQDNNSCEYNSCAFRWGTSEFYMYACYDEMNTEEKCKENYDNFRSTPYNSESSFQVSDVNYYELYDDTCVQYCKFKNTSKSACEDMD